MIWPKPRSVKWKQESAYVTTSEASRGLISREGFAAHHAQSSDEQRYPVPRHLVDGYREFTPTSGVTWALPVLMIFASAMHSLFWVGSIGSG
jgi:hypothetical protein